MRWYEVANLPRNVELGTCWLDRLFFMTALWQGYTVKPKLFLSKPKDASESIALMLMKLLFGSGVTVLLVRPVPEYL